MIIYGASGMLYFNPGWPPGLDSIEVELDLIESTIDADALAAVECAAAAPKSHSTPAVVFPSEVSLKRWGAP